MNNKLLYLCQIRKDKRTRIKVCFEESLAKATLVTCHVPEYAGMSFAWEINEVVWNLAVEEEKKIFEQFLFACQKEEIRNFKIAFEEGIKFNKRCVKQNKLEREAAGKKNYYVPVREKDSFDKPFFHSSNLSVKKKIITQETNLPRFIDYTPVISVEEIIAKILTIKEGRF